MVKCKGFILPLFFFAWLFSGCLSSGKKELAINFSADSTALIFDGIDQAGLTQLKHTDHPDSVLAELISVLQTPSENDTAIVESPVPGRFKLTENNIVFKPNTPFVRRRDYLVITHLNSNFGDLKKIMAGKLDARVKPLQKLLSR